MIFNIHTFRIILILIVSVSSVAAGLPPAPEPTSISTAVLPSGDHRDLVVRKCAVCHPPELVVAQKRTEDQWDEIIARMVSRGAEATDEEQEKIFEYLTKYFNSASASPPAKTEP